MDDKTITKIINDIFKKYGNRIREHVIKRFLKNKYKIENENEMMRLLARAEELGLITICASPYSYGELLIVKGNIKDDDESSLLVF